MSKKNITTIVIVVIIAAIGAAAYYFYNRETESGFVKGARETENWAKGVGKAIGGK